MDVPPKLIRRGLKGVTQTPAQTDGGEDSARPSDEDVEPKVLERDSPAELQVQSSSLASRDSSDALSVLESLRDFLETERARARNRMFILAGFFTVLLLLSVFGGLYVVLTIRHQMNTSMYQLRNDQNMSQQSYVQTASLVHDIASQAQNMQKRMEHNNATREEQVRVMEQQVQSFQTVRKMLTEMELENRALASEYQRFRRHVAELTNRLGRMETAAPTMPELRIAASAPETVREPYTPPEENPGASDMGRRDHVEFSITPRGGDHAISWRLPLP